MMSLVDVVGDVVVPAVRAVFREDEVTSIEVQTDAAKGSVSLTLTAEGETFHDNVVQGHVGDMSSADWSDRLRSNLVDFVAESGFGWGQNRDTLRPHQDWPHH